MQTPRHLELEKLRSLFAGLDAGADESIGLLLAPDLHHSGYEATPRDSLLFANTGGDGVHFSVLTSQAVEPSKWPVVMTVPMEFDRPNYVLGADFKEFLAIGLRIGYFFLEQLAYDPEWLFAELEHPQGQIEVSELMSRTLDAIGDTFSIEPWQNHCQRLAWLESNIPLDWS